MRRSSDLLTFAVTVGRRTDEHDIRYPAAALDYDSFFSLLPVRVHVVAVGGERMGT